MGLTRKCHVLFALCLVLIIPVPDLHLAQKSVVRITDYPNMTSAEALPEVLGNRAFISEEQRNKGQILRGTGEQRQFWGTGNIRKQVFDVRGTVE